MAKEKLITLHLLNVFKTKMQEWTSSQDQTLKTEVSANYIKTVEVTSNDQTDEQGVTKTTYTFSFKNGAGTEISTASVASGGGYTKATAEKDGLMSKEDKAKLDSYELVTDAEIEDLFKAVSENTGA